jgi:hypothetical protein
MAVLAAPTARVFGQSASWRFHWGKGQIMTYRVEHLTTVTELENGKKMEVTSRLNLLKRWQVQDVDSQGNADISLTLAAMRNEQVRPGGEVLLFDSEHPDKSTPELRAQMGKFIGQTLAVFKIDLHGKVISVSKGSAASYDSEPPFVLHLPLQVPAAGHAWERPYQVALDPPFGTGEKYQGVQKYQVSKLDGGLAHLHLTTTLKLPEPAADRVPLLQKLPQGEIVFNVSQGRLQSADLHIDQQVQGHLGAGSSYRLVSRYREEIVEGR